MAEKHDGDSRRAKPQAPVGLDSNPVTSRQDRNPVPRGAGQRKPVVGLVGGVGSGKSRVAGEFAARGARLISGDQLGHEGLRQPAIREQVVQRWGPGVLDPQGEIDRRKLGAIVFADPTERRALEALVFPWIEKRFREEIDAAESDPAVRLVVLDAAVMLEAGWNHVCDWLVFVEAPREVRLRRLLEQRGWSAKEVAARETAQMPLDEKISHADYVVDNSGSPEHCARQVEELLRGWGIPTLPPLRRGEKT